MLHHRKRPPVGVGGRETNRAPAYKARGAAAMIQDVEELVAAYDQILRDLDLERSSSLAETIAKEIFELVEQGVRTRKQLTEMVMEEMGGG